MRRGSEWVHTKIIQKKYQNGIDGILKYGTRITILVELFWKDAYIRGFGKRGIFLIYIAAFSIQIPIIIDIVKYSLQLKYAKKYGMLDLLPSAPNEELTP